MLSEKEKIDPWDNRQEIENVKLTIHCSRYWMLSEWECANLSFPFWRLYHSRTGGSFVRWHDRDVELCRGKLVVIPPNTSFSSFILKNNNLQKAESIQGVRISTEQEVALYKENSMCDQFFVHFSLGYPYDCIHPGIYELLLNEERINDIQKIECLRLGQQNKIDFQETMRINELILHALSAVPATQWNFPKIDFRILKVIKYIDNHVKDDISNDDLAQIANMATNSFARLFRENIHCPAKQYIQQTRIDYSVKMLLHSDLSIDDIAQQCGYFDRHHYSKVFKKITGMAPVYYRKKMSGIPQSINSTLTD